MDVKSKELALLLLVVGCCARKDTKHAPYD